MAPAMSLAAAVPKPVEVASGALRLSARSCVSFTADFFMTFILSIVVVVVPASAGHEFGELVLGAESMFRDLVREAFVERLRCQTAASGPESSDVEQLDHDGGRVVVGADMDLARDCGGQGEPAAHCLAEIVLLQGAELERDAGHGEEAAGVFDIG